MLAPQLLLFNATSVGGGNNELSSGCINALLEPVACDPALLLYATSRYGGAIDEAVLNTRLCSSPCTSSLQDYRNSVHNACIDDPDLWGGFPATHTADFVEAYQNITCLRDKTSGGYCVNELASIATTGQVDQIHDLPHDLICSECVLSLMHEAQKSEFSSYDAETAKSWTAIQSACGLNGTYSTDVPVRTHQSKLVEFGSGTGWKSHAAMQTSEKLSSLTCSEGTMYHPASLETLQEVSREFNVSTSTLRMLNGIDESETELAAGQSICLPFSCLTFSVMGGETCFSVLKMNKLTWTQLLAYNPGLNTDCSNLVVGEQICVSGPMRQLDARLI